MTAKVATANEAAASGEKSREAGNAPHPGDVALRSFSTLPQNMFDLLVVSLFSNLLALALPLSLLQVYDRILPNASLGTMLLLMGGVAAALLFDVILQIGRSHITGWVGARFEFKAGCAAMERVLGSRLDVFERTGSGVHLERLNALLQVREFYSGQAILSLLDLPFSFLYFILIALLGGWLVLVPLGLMLVFGFMAIRLGTKLKHMIKTRLTSDERRFNFLIEVLGGIHSVKAMAMENSMLRRYERLQESCAQGQHDVSLLSTSAMGLSSFFNQLTMVAVAAVGSTFVISGDMTTGALAACSLLSGRAMQPLQRALGIWSRFQTFQLSRDRLREVFELEPESQVGLPALPPVDGELEMRNVSFRYDEKLPWIIKDASIKIATGECVAILGNNGGGKSTLLALMQGALAPAEGGEVLVDGMALARHDPVSVRNQIAYLPQHGQLFQGSILQNITMFRPKYDIVALDLAEMLGLEEVVATMAQGYDTQVGDGAYDSLPRGIKQRIAVARALVGTPRVVLFDEANTAVDGAGDKAIIGALERMKGRNTLVLVTHRPSLVKMADRSFDLKDGRLIERVPQDGGGAR